MKAFCYTRTESEADAKERQQAMATWCGNNEIDYAGFSTDGLQGQLGLTKARRRAENAAAEGDGSMLVVWTLADLARDINSLIKTLVTLIDKGIRVHARLTNLDFQKRFGGDSTETCVIRALAEAHIRYVSENRKIGVQSARAAGAQIGRPKGWTLESARETIKRLEGAKTQKGDRKPGKRLTNGKESHLPSARELARTLGCGTTKAAELLNEYKAEQEAKEETE